LTRAADAGAGQHIPNHQTQQVNDALEVAGDDDSAAAAHAGRELLAAGEAW
jgi:hypothetical protein